jgi:hypothetical protein
MTSTDAASRSSSCGESSRAVSARKTGRSLGPSPSSFFPARCLAGRRTPGVRRWAHPRAVRWRHIHRGIRVHTRRIRVHPSGRRLARLGGITNAVVLLLHGIRGDHASIRRVDFRGVGLDARRRTSGILRIRSRGRRGWIRRRRRLRMYYSRSGHNGSGGDEFQKHDTASLYAVHRSTPRRSLVHEELVVSGCKRWTAGPDICPISVKKRAADLVM